MKEIFFKAFYGKHKKSLQKYSVDNHDTFKLNLTINLQTRLDR